MKPGIGWPIGIVVILGATIVGNLLMMRVAANDPSFAIEPDYYRKAVHFDEAMAQARRNRAIGWIVTPQVDPVASGRATGVHVHVRDRLGMPVTGARLTLMARFNARANDTLTAALTEEGAGRYRTLLAVSVPGEWEFRIDADRDNTHYSAVHRVTVERLSAQQGTRPQ
jgi:nitrogen fixation protein FixH